MGDIVLGLDTLDAYLSSDPYFGALIGRYCNRIANGRFTLDGITFQLDNNGGEHHLHGGVQGFDKKHWDMQPFVTENSAGVVLTLVSPDGDQGYPGKLNTRVTFELTNDNELDTRFSATSDKPTIVNMTQHSYFNLAGAGDILGHELMICANCITPVDKSMIPTGELRPVEGTPFDFRQAKPIGQDIQANDEQLLLGHGYDHNFVLKDKTSDELVDTEATAFNVFAGSDLIIPDLQMDEDLGASYTLDLPAGNYDLQFVAADESQALLYSVTVDLQADTAHLLSVTGSQEAPEVFLEVTEMDTLEAFASVPRPPAVINGP